MTLVIDAVSNLFTPEVVETRPSWSSSHMRKRFAVDEDRLIGVPVKDQLDEMDHAGVDMAILVIQMMGSPGSPGFWNMDSRFVIDAIATHPDRFLGQAGIDPTAGPSGIRRLRSLVQDYGFVGAHFYPHWFDLQPDAPIVFPYYATCEELGIPVQIQVGQALVYNADRPMRSLGHPTALEPIASTFPHLQVIGSHLGYPWTDEMIALAQVYPNVSICTDSYAPKHWSPTMNAYAAGDGSGKVMFGTMWPTIAFDRAITEIKQKDMSGEAMANLLGGTAQSVYGLVDERS